MLQSKRLPCKGSLFTAKSQCREPGSDSSGTQGRNDYHPTGARNCLRRLTAKLQFSKPGNDTGRVWEVTIPSAPSTHCPRRLAAKLQFSKPGNDTERVWEATIPSAPSTHYLRPLAAWRLTGPASDRFPGSSLFCAGLRRIPSSVPRAARSRSAPVRPSPWR